MQVGGPGKIHKLCFGGGVITNLEGLYPDMLRTPQRREGSNKWYYEWQLYGTLLLLQLDTVKPPYAFNEPLLGQASFQLPFYHTVQSLCAYYHYPPLLKQRL